MENYNIEMDLSDQGQILWNLFKKYYNKDSTATHIDRGVLKIAVAREHPKHEAMFATVIDSLAETSIPNLIHEVLEQKIDRNSLQLTQALVSGHNDKVLSLFGERELLLAGELEADTSSDICIAPSLKELFAARSAENRITVYPPVLNDALEGGALRGHHIVLFAVTDLGKTLFSLNMVRGFIENGLRVLYVGNEDPLSDLIERFLVCLTGKDKWTVRKNPEKTENLARKKGWDNLIWAELCPGTLEEIGSLIEKYKPDVLIVDQIRNLDTGDKDFVRTLEKAAKGMRNFAKRHSLLAISITQAADSADGRAVLGRGDIDNSNVGIPGTADLMLGIGATQQQEFEGVRTLSFPKNKISGQKQPLQVFFNHKTMRVD